VGEVEAGFDQWAIRVGVSYKFGNR
jgi:hypothetical protein